MADQGDVESVAELADLPALPRHGAHLWGWFSELHATRQSNGMGASRLTRLEIQAWERDEGITLARWERRGLMAIDAAWLAAVSDDLKQSHDPEAKP